MANYLAEAFKAFEALEEDTFEINDEGIEQLDGFIDDSSAFDKETIDIFDVDAEEEEDLKDSYVGDAILDCNVCHEKLFKKKEDIIIDEDTQMANVGEECPYCFAVDGFKVVGEIAPFQSKKEKEEAEVEETEEVTEAFEKAGGPFWYFTKHGVQPGSVPKGISVGEVKDTPEGTFFTSDKVLTTKELNDFDIVEKKPLKEGIFNRKKDYAEDIKNIFGSDAGVVANEVVNNADRVIKEVVDSLGDESSSKNIAKKFITISKNAKSTASKTPQSLVKNIVNIGTTNAPDAMGLDELKDFTSKLGKLQTASKTGYKAMEYLMSMVNDKLVSLFDRTAKSLQNEFAIHECREVKKGYMAKKPIKEDTVKQDGKWVNKGKEGTHGTFRTKKEADAQRKAMFARGFKEELKKKLIPESLGSDVAKYQKWVDYDMKRYHNISDKTNEEVKKAGLQIVKDKYGDYQVIAGRYDEPLKESVEPGKYVIRSFAKAANPYVTAYSRKTGKHIGYLGHGGRSWVPADSKDIMTFDTYEEAASRAKNQADYYNAEVFKVERPLELEENCNRKFTGKSNKSLEESVEDIAITTDDSKIEVKAEEDGKITVEAEPKEDCCEEEEVIKPLSKEDEEKIEDNDEEIEEVDEESFDELEESFLKKVYSNVDSYKTTSIDKKDGKFFVEGFIKFNSGKTKKASFVFESVGKTPRNKYRFIGESIQITPKKNAFRIIGNKVGKKFVAESMNYDFRTKNLNESIRINGRVVTTIKEAVDLSDKKGSITNVLTSHKEEISKASSVKEMLDLLNRWFKEEGIDTPASKRLINTVSKKKDIADAQFAVYNSILKGAGQGVI